MPSTTGKKYVGEDSEHYYQNQHDSVNNNRKKTRIKNKANQSQNRNRNANNTTSNNNMNTSTNQTNGFSQLSTSSSSGCASSTVSSQKSLISYQKQLNVSYCFLVLAILCEILPLLGIAVTFIFPFWILFEIDTLPSAALVNVTNIETSVSLIESNASNIEYNTYYNSNNMTRIAFELGLWEVRMHQNLELVDLNTRISSKNSFSMLWLNADDHLPSQSFLVMFMSFIKLSSANLFCVQILEIIHIIFAFLTFCSTSFTLCLCSNHKTSLCWYLVCYFICLVAFLTGLAVIVLILTWKTSSMPNLTTLSTQKLIVTKSFNWCFWLAVGINSSLLFASFLILFYILVASILLYYHRKREYELTKRDATLTNRSNQFLMTNNMRNTNLNGTPIVTNGLNITNTLSNFSSPNQNTRLPRLQATTIPSTSNNSRNSNQLPSTTHVVQIVNQENLQSIENSNPNNHSYIFYTGHGNYHKQNIPLDLIEDSKPEYEPPNDFIQPHHLLGYSMMMQHQKQFNLNSTTNNNDHPYSNVIDQMHQQQEFRLASYR